MFFRDIEFFQPARGSGGMLPQKSLKIKPLKSAEIAFQRNLLGNFFRFKSSLLIFLNFHRTK